MSEVLKGLYCQCGLSNWNREDAPACPNCRRPWPKNLFQRTKGDIGPDIFHAPHTFYEPGDKVIHMRWEWEGIFIEYLDCDEVAVVWTADDGVETMHLSEIKPPPLLIPGFREVFNRGRARMCLLPKGEEEIFWIQAPGQTQETLEAISDILRQSNIEGFATSFEADISKVTKEDLRLLIEFLEEYCNTD